MIWEEFVQEGAIFAGRDGTVILGLAPFTWQKKPSDFSFYAPDFFLQAEKPYLQPERVIRMQKEQFLQQLPSCNTLEPLIWERDPFALFSRQFAELQQKIKEDSLTKGVLYSAVRAKKALARSHLLHLFSLAARPHLTLFGFWNCQGGMVGLSPERLFKKTERKIETEALAGTMNPSHATIPAFLEDPKEKKEHQIVVDAIVKALSPYGKVKISPSDALSLGSLVHCITGIVAEGSVTTEELLSVLHPTPALGAAPREIGQQWLKEIASEIPRQRYGAPFGWVEGDLAELVVAIRMIQWDPAGSSIFAGSGVVAESVLQNEWSEIERKINSVIKGFSVG